MRHIRSIRGRTWLIAVLSFCSFLIPAAIGLARQLPNWPQTQSFNDTRCAPGGTACANCYVPGTPVGCTTNIPVQWSVGSCIDAPNFTCTASAFACGAQLVCLTGNPNGLTCPSPDICK